MRKKASINQLKKKEGAMTTNIEDIRSKIKNKK